MGILSIFMATAVSFGLCSAVGVPYSPVHTILPLLLLGLGVDDMFVIVQSWENLTKEVSEDFKGLIHSNKIFLYIWRPPSLSELTPMISNTGLIHLSSETSI